MHAQRSNINTTFGYILNASPMHDLSQLVRDSSITCTYQHRYLKTQYTDYTTQSYVSARCAYEKGPTELANENDWSR